LPDQQGFAGGRVLETGIGEHIVQLFFAALETSRETKPELVDGLRLLHEEQRLYQERALVELYERLAQERP